MEGQPVKKPTGHLARMPLDAACRRWLRPTPPRAGAGGGGLIGDSPGPRATARLAGGPDPGCCRVGVVADIAARHPGCLEGTIWSQHRPEARQSAHITIERYRAPQDGAHPGARRMARRMAALPKATLSKMIDACRRQCSHWLPGVVELWVPRN